MNRSEYLKAVNEFMYQGEVLGEALLDRYVAMEPEPSDATSGEPFFSLRPRPRRACGRF